MFRAASLAARASPATRRNESWPLGDPGFEPARLFDHPLLPEPEPLACGLGFWPIAKAAFFPLRQVLFRHRLAVEIFL